MRSIVEEDLKELTQFKQSNWKEQISYILSYSKGEEKKEFALNLGEELVAKRDLNSAMICFMLSKDIEKVVDMWKKRINFFLKKGHDRNE